MRSKLAAAGTALALTFVLAACSSVTDRVLAAVDSASSATASASTVLQELDDGRALPAFADTVLGDALTELNGATTDLTNSGPIGDASATSVRDQALDTIESATDAVLAARETVASGGDPASDIEAVDDATDRLHAMADSLSPKGSAP